MCNQEMLLSVKNKLTVFLITHLYFRNGFSMLHTSKASSNFRMKKCS